jgi:hypothetical protein
VVDEEFAEHPHVAGAPALRHLVGGERLGDLVGEAVQLDAYGGPYGRDAAVPFAYDEADVRGVLAYVTGDRGDGALDARGLVGRAGEDLVYDTVEAAERLLDEGDAQVAHVLEVPVEGRRGHSHDAGHLAQTEAAEALVLQQLQSGVEQGAAGPRLLGLAGGRCGRGGVAHVIE